MTKKYNCCSYPFLKETSLKCDYEIMTDELSSLLGLCDASCKHIEELGKLVEITYHLNGSVRGKNAIEETDLDFIDRAHEKYHQILGEKTKTFVLPKGCIGACHLHLARVKAKEVARLLYKIDREENKVDQILFDFVNLLSNTLFLMAIFENQEEGIDEVKFVSKSY